MIMERGDIITISPKRPFFSRSVATSFNLNNAIFFVWREIVEGFSCTFCLNCKLCRFLAKEEIPKSKRFIRKEEKIQEIEKKMDSKKRSTYAKMTCCSLNCGRSFFAFWKVKNSPNGIIHHSFSAPWKNGNYFSFDKKWLSMCWIENNDAKNRG